MFDTAVPFEYTAVLKAALGQPQLPQGMDHGACDPSSRVHGGSIQAKASARQ